MPATEKCFSCDKPLHRTRLVAVATDGQTVYVGPDCYRKIIEAAGREKAEAASCETASQPSMHKETSGLLGAADLGAADQVEK